MNATACDSDVIVVGAGPVGMTCAALLASYGVSVVALESQLVPEALPKAISIDDESLRTYQMAGIVDRIQSIVVPGTGTQYFDSNGRLLFKAVGPGVFRQGFPFKNPFAQPDLEATLRDVLEESQLVEVLYGSRVVGLDHCEDGVVLRAVESGREVEYRARFVIGADGGRSTIRQLLDVEMAGRSYSDNWLVADMLDDDHNQRCAMHFGDPARPYVIIPGLKRRCRYEFYLHPGEAEVGPVVDFSLIERLLAPHRRVEPGHIERAVVYRFNGLNALQWRVGRTFLMGDAAHMMPPFAGQGVNSGIRDATNLAWKMAAVVQGKAPEKLLESYEAERRPHTSQTIALSERLGRIVFTTRPAFAEVRDRRVRGILGSPQGRAYLEEMQYRPPMRLTTGAVYNPECEGVGAIIAQPRGFEMSTARVRMLDDVMGNGWSLLGVAVAATTWSRATEVVAQLAARPLQVVIDDILPESVPGVGEIVDVDGDLQAEFAMFRGKFLLVRPDRYLAAVWEPEQSGDVGRWISEELTVGATQSLVFSSNG